MVKWKVLGASNIPLAVNNASLFTNVIAWLVHVGITLSVPSIVLSFVAILSIEFWIVSLFRHWKSIISYIITICFCWFNIALILTVHFPIIRCFLYMILSLLSLAGWYWFPGNWAFIVKYHYSRVLRVDSEWYLTILLIDCLLTWIIVAIQLLSYGKA